MKKVWWMGGWMDGRVDGSVEAKVSIIIAYSNHEFQFFRPKDYAHEELDDYKRAEQIGLSRKDCASQFQKCPISLFDVVPVIIFFTIFYNFIYFLIFGYKLYISGWIVFSS